jgi:hypothetical protein
MNRRRKREVKVHKGRGERFLSIIENVVHGRQQLANKIMKTVNATVNDTAQINNIKNQQWADFYKSL